MGKLFKALVGILIIAGVMSFVVLMGSLVYPGALKWTSNWTCPDDKPDTIVVRDTYQTEPGETSTNFTLYCLGERGEFEDAGFGKPVLILMAFGVVWAVGIALLIMLAGVFTGLFRRIRDGGGDDGGGDDDDDDDSDIEMSNLDDFEGMGPIIT